MECTELTHGKGQKQPSSHFRTELSKAQFFPVSLNYMLTRVPNFTTYLHHNLHWAR